MSKGPSRSRSFRSVGVNLGQTLGSTDVGGGHNDTVRRLATGHGTGAGLGGHSDLTVIRMVLTVVAAPFSVTPSDEFGGTYSYPDGFAPTNSGYYDIDVTWEWTGGPADTIQEISATGPPYHSGQPGGFGHVHLDGSGDGVGSVHWQGDLGSASDEGLAIGGTVPDGTWVAQMTGRLVKAAA